MEQVKINRIKDFLRLTIENNRREAAELLRFASTKEGTKAERQEARRKAEARNVQNRKYSEELARIESGYEPTLEFTEDDLNKVPESPSASPVKVFDKTAVGALLAKLNLLNGLEVYDPASSPDTPLSGNKMMMIPLGTVPAIAVKDSGNIGMKTGLLADESVMLRIAAVNFVALKADNHPEAAKVALLRAMIACRGFMFQANPDDFSIGDQVAARYCKRSEISIVDDTNELSFGHGKVVTGFSAALNDLSAFINSSVAEKMQAMTVLLPIFASIEFQKTNHHYVDNEFYRESYRRHFNSCVINDYNDEFNKAHVIYDAVHWLGPYNMEMWKSNLHQKAPTKIPRGLKIKMYPNPSGTAVITTQLAVWNAIAVFPGTEELIKRYEKELKLMQTMANKIKTGRLYYHVFASLFGVVSHLEDEDMELALKVSASLAGIAQGFIEAVCQGSDLGRAKALKKHAQQNIALYNISKAAFQGAQQRMRKDAREKSVSDVVVRASRKVEEVEQSRVLELEGGEDNND